MNIAQIYAAATENPPLPAELKAIEDENNKQTQAKLDKKAALESWLEIPTTRLFLARVEEERQKAAEAAENIGANPSDNWKVAEQLTIAKTLRKVLDTYVKEIYSVNES